MRRLVRKLEAELAKSEGLRRFSVGQYFGSKICRAWSLHRQRAVVKKSFGTL